MGILFNLKKSLLAAFVIAILLASSIYIYKAYGQTVPVVTFSISEGQETYIRTFNIGTFPNFNGFLYVDFNTGVYRDDSCTDFTLATQLSQYLTITDADDIVLPNLRYQGASRTSTNFAHGTVGTNSALDYGTYKLKLSNNWYYDPDGGLVGPDCDRADSSLARTVTFKVVEDTDPEVPPQADITLFTLNGATFTRTLPEVSNNANSPITYSLTRSGGIFPIPNIQFNPSSRVLTIDRAVPVTDFNGFYYRATDRDGGSGDSQYFEIEVIESTITINEPAGGPAVSKTYTATATPSNRVQGIVINSGASCNAAAFGSYTGPPNAPTVTVDSTSDNGRFVCFRAGTASEFTVYQRSSSAISEITDVSINIVDPGTSPAMEKVFTATATPAAANLNLEVYTVPIASSSSCSSGGGLVATFINFSRVVFSDESENGNFVCFRTRISDTDDYIYQASAEIGGIDTTAPNISHTAYFRRNGLVTINEFAKKGDVITVEIGTEDLPTTPTVTIAGRSALVTVEVGGYFAKIIVEDGDPQGYLNYDIGELQDVAGNTFDPDPVQLPIIGRDSIVIDTIAPTITANSVAFTGGIVNGTTTYLNTGDKIDFSYTFSEELGSDSFLGFVKTGMITSRGATFTRVGITNEYTSTYTITNVENADPSSINLDPVFDIAGNPYNRPEDTGYDFVIDTTTPDISGTNVIRTTGENPVDGKDYLNAGDTVTLEFNTDENLSVNPSVTIAGQSATVSVSGTGWTAVYAVSDSATQGNLLYQIGKLTDIAGNESPDPVSNVDNPNIIIDTILPAAPGTPNLEGDDDTCREISSSCVFGTDEDNITSNTTGLTFGITKEANSALRLRRNGTNVGPSGRTSLTSQNISIALAAQNTYNMTAIQTDRAGNVSPVSGILIVTIDTMAPTVPDNVDLIDGSDSGISNSDNLTNDDTPVVIAPVIPAYTRLELYQGPSRINSFDNAGNSPSSVIGFTIAPALVDDPYTFKTELYDLAGNESGQNSGLTIRIDTTTPEATIDLDAGSDSGASDADNVTNDTTPTFGLASLESSADPTAGTGQAKIEVYNWDGGGTYNADTGPPSSNLTELFTITDAGATTQDVVIGTDLTTRPFPEIDGIANYRLVLKQTDDAGNVTWTNPNKVTNQDDSQWFTIDTTAPAAPTNPDLRAEDDSFGVNRNGARSGDNNDNITNKQADLSFASFTISTDHIATNVNGGAHDGHQIRFYEWVDANTDTVVDDTELTQLKIPTGAGPDNVRGSSNIIASVSGYDGSGSGLAKDLYTTPDILIEGTHYFVAKQYDIAGNLSDVSTNLNIVVDITPPSRVTFDLELHPTSDTGTSSDDKQTSSVTPIFRIPFSTPLAAGSEDIDYFEVRRVQLDDDLVAIGGGDFAYPSDNSNVEQTSYEYFGADTNPRGSLVGETETTYGDGAYAGGVTIEVVSMNVPAFNTWYSFAVYAIDLAGNARQGVDVNNIRILIPPVKPDKLDLVTASDSTRGSLSGGNSDDITNVDSWNLTGTYQNTTQPERDNAAAKGVERVEIRIVEIDSIGSEIGSPIIIPKVKDLITPANNDINVTGTEPNEVYDYSHTFDATSFSDGRYSISVVAFNGAGEAGATSDSLVITRDTIAPVPNEYIKVKSARYLTFPNVLNHRFTGTYNSPENRARAKVRHQEPVGGSKNNRTEDIESGRGAFHTGITTISDDFSTYSIEYIDAAGNTTGFIPLPDYIKAPLLTSYLIDLSSDKYLVIGNEQADRETAIGEPAPITEFRRFTQGSASALCNPRHSSNPTRTSYIERDVLTAPADGLCIEAVDTNDNRGTVGIVREKKDLIANSEVHDDDDTGGNPNDNILNTNSFRYIGTTIPGSTGRIQYKLSSGTWDTDATEVAFTPDATTGDIEVSFTTSADGDYDVRGYVTNTSILGPSEIGPITLTGFTIDTIAPLAATSATATKSGDETITTDRLVTKRNTINAVFTFGYATDTLTSELFINGTSNPATSTSASNDITFASIDFTGLEDGEHGLGIVVEDVAGNKSVNSGTLFTIVRDNISPDVVLLRLNDTDTTIDPATRFISVANDLNLYSASYKYINLAKAACDGIASNNNLTGVVGTTEDYNSPDIVNPDDGASDGVCFYVRDGALNFGSKHSSESIEGVGNLEITGGTKVGTDYYTKSGAVEITGVTAGGAKVLIKLQASGDTPPTEDERKNVAYADFSFDIAATDSAFTETITLSSTHNGRNIVAWIWTDSADSNTQTPPISLGTLNVDDTPPTITAVSFVSTNTSDPSFAKQGDTITASINTNELLQSITSTIAGETTTCGAIPTADPTGTTVDCNVTLTNAAEEGLAVLETTLTDLAGNVGAVPRTSAITVDAVAPEVSFSSSKPSRFIKTGDPLSIRISITDTNEITAGSYTFTVGGAGTASCDVVVPASSSSVSESCSVSVTSTTDGEKLTVTSPPITDASGNSNTYPAQELHDVDTSAPSIESVLEVDTSNRRQVEIPIQVIFEQDVANSGTPESLRPVFGNDCSDFDVDVSWTSNTPTDGLPITFTALIVRPDTGRYENCNVKLVDEAGNESVEVSIPEFAVKGGGGGGGTTKTVVSYYRSPINNDETKAIITSTQPFIPAPSISGTSSTRNLTVDSTGEDVRNLQRFLNNNGFPIAETGPGSQGQETTFFGELTRQALASYQEEVGISPANGFYGPITRARIFGTGRTTRTIEQPTTSLPSTRNLTLDSTGEDVRNLQRFLNNNGFPIAETGPGSQGQETTFFGELTRQALASYQEEVGISPASGFYGPITRARILGTISPTVPTLIPRSDDEDIDPTTPRQAVQFTQPPTFSSPTTPVFQQPIFQPTVRVEEDEEEIQFTQPTERRAIIIESPFNPFSN